jgi:hypothetical protein
MAKLATKRCLFHGEKDFQHALAWEMRLSGHDIRLEYKPRTFKERAYIDVWTRDARPVAIELKYRTCLLSIEVDQEVFELTNQSAGDHGRYDLWRDVSRLERVVASGEAAEGYAVFLTNDSSYWRAGRAGTADEQYRMEQGKVVNGLLSWAPHTGSGTKRGREQPILLQHQYELNWHDYSDLSVPKGRFRFLCVAVRRPDHGAQIVESRSV